MNVSRIRILGQILGIGLFLALSALSALAQSDNTQISGFVKDQAGSVVPSAKVVVKSESKEFERTTATNSEGYFVVTQLPPGFYTILVEAAGFKQFRETNRKLDPNIPASVDIALQPGQVTETVSVTASAASIQTESSTVGKSIRSKSSSSTDAIRSFWRSSNQASAAAARSAASASV